MDTSESAGAPFDLVVIGAGPAGLTAAEEAQRRGWRPLVLEANSQVGGISRTVRWRGNHIDIGGHRFFTNDARVLQRWQEWTGGRMREVPRLSRILYRRKFYAYPLNLCDVLLNFGLIDLARAGASYACSLARPIRPEVSFADWVSNRFGHFLFRRFFKSYTEKVWGISCDRLRADWAAQRIAGMSLPVAVLNALGRGRGARSLADRFLYPALGPGSLWEAVADRVVAAGGELRLEERVVGIAHRDRRVVSVETEAAGGTRRMLPVQRLVTTMPLGDLIAALDPPAPAAVRAAAAALRHRDFLVVALSVARPEIFPDNWLYIHDEGYQVGRIQNAGNWSPQLVGGPGTSLILMEYFCSRGDALWNQDDAALVRLAAGELAGLGFADTCEITDGHVIRELNAYPVYDEAYRSHLDIIRTYLEPFGNLSPAGRSGLHRYNNQDHAMLSGMAAVDVLAGVPGTSAWDVNIARSHHEEQVVAS
ncbi:FAD-dependent oxidoreductase [Prosthecomicrobium hirschii]|uniref:FAD-dependent oxidoreductase n=1 Tax=Prosthecodimorpha hirschii TaxID=665126 RepID=UPI00112A89EA|nr:FAD-dependent oxidoreductase [Prosthecomicrobium hirschii]TPQ50915.1 FAD-dependent oxidoreductase [Prosthecomicrobium hirschii]